MRFQYPYLARAGDSKFASLGLGGDCDQLVIEGQCLDENFRRGKKVELAAGDVGYVAFLAECEGCKRLQRGCWGSGEDLYE